jgi:hypothetical protein
MDQIDAEAARKLIARSDVVRQAVLAYLANPE